MAFDTELVMEALRAGIDVDTFRFPAIATEQIDGLAETASDIEKSSLECLFPSFKKWRVGPPDPLRAAACRVDAILPDRGLTGIVEIIDLTIGVPILGQNAGIGSDRRIAIPTRAAQHPEIRSSLTDRGAPFLDLRIARMCDAPPLRFIADRTTHALTPLTLGATLSR
jgi:hypothetical protein